MEAIVVLLLQFEIHKDSIMTYALAVREVFAKFSMKALPPVCKTEEIYLPLVKAVLLPDEELLPCHYDTKK